MTDADKNKLILESLRARPCAVCLEKVGIDSPDSGEVCSLCGLSFKRRVAERAVQQSAATHGASRA